MRWGPGWDKAPKEFDYRYVWRFALLPSRSNVDGRWTWLERHVVIEYWYPVGGWSLAWDGYSTTYHNCVYDCRTEAE